MAAEMVGNKIHVDYGPYNRLRNDYAKTIRGYLYLKKKKRWTYPLDWRTCLEIREVANKLGEDLEIGPNLTRWAKAEKARLEFVPDVKDMKLALMEVLPDKNPYLYSAMKDRPFQTVGASFLAGWRTGLIADEMGLGKTMQAIGAIQEADINGPILVVAPKNAAILTWPYQLDEWAPDEPYTLIAGKSKAARDKEVRAFINRQMKPGFDRKQREWLIINPYWLRMTAEVDDKGNYTNSKDDRLRGIGATFAMPELFELEWSAIVVDESHEVLCIKSMNRKKWTGWRTGLENIPQPREGMRIAMSGTPARGKKEQFYGTLNWLRPEHYRGYWKWVERHFDIHKDQWSSTVGGLRDEKKFYDELSEIMIRRTKLEVADDLPPIIYGGTHLDPHDHKSPVGVWIPMGPKQTKQYQAMVNDGVVRTATGQELMANGILSEWTRMKQLATAVGDFNEDGEYVPSGESNKMDWIIQFLDERGIAKVSEGDGKVIIASQFAHVCKFVATTLQKEGIPSFLLTGATKQLDRVNMMKDFQDQSNTDVRVFILSTKAGGVSLTLDAADDVIIMDETWIPDDQQQIEARAHRISRIDHQVSVWYLRSLGTIEEAISAVTTERGDDLSAIMDKSRGVDVRKDIREYKPIVRKTA